MFLISLMTSKRTKTILSASLIAAVVSLFGAMYFINTATDDSNINNENTNELINMLPKGLSEELVPNLTAILELESQKADTENENTIKQLDEQILANKKQMATIQKAIEDKRRIDPQLTDKLDSIIDIILSDKELPIFIATVDRDSVVIILKEGTENQGWESKVNEKIPDGVKSKILYESSQDWACVDANGYCDPLRGGIGIGEAGSDTYSCTLGLPVKQNVTVGYITAGHCYSVNDVIYQPYQIGLGNSILGNVSDAIDNANCDCAFITKNNARTDESEIWINSVLTTPITGTVLPANGATVYLSGATGGWYTEVVVNNNANGRGGLQNIILISNNGTGGPGDSGAPVYNYIDDEFIGTLKGVADNTGQYIIVIPWAKISNSTVGLGVSLLP